MYKLLRSNKWRIIRFDTLHGNYTRSYDYKHVRRQSAKFLYNFKSVITENLIFSKGYWTAKNRLKIKSEFDEVITSAGLKFALTT